MTFSRHAAAKSPLAVLWRPLEAQGFPPVSGDAIRIRPFRDDADIELWLRIQNASFAQRASRAWGRLEFRRELSQRSWWAPDRLLLAWLGNDDVPVGTVAWEPIAATGWILLHWLGVHPAARRRGVARALVEAVADENRGTGFRGLRAETLRTCVEAVECYQALGFRETEPDATLI